MRRASKLLSARQGGRWLGECVTLDKKFYNPCKKPPTWGPNDDQMSIILLGSPNCQ